MNFWKVTLADLKTIFTNKVLIIFILGIIAIPLVYGGLYIHAFWDPYGHTERVEVAVVNLDKGFIDDDGNMINHGEDAVTSLKYNDDVGWNFLTDKQEALDKLEGDGYYALFIIPEDFSNNLETISEGNITKPVINYIANDKKNYINSIITSKVATAFQSTVADGIVDTFALATYKNLEELRDGMASASEGTSELVDGIKTLKNNIPALSSGVEDLYEGLDTFEGKMTDAYDGVNILKDSIAQLRDQMPDLIEGASDLDDGTKSFKAVVAKVNDGTIILSDSVGLFKDNIPALEDGIEDLYDGTLYLNDVLGQLTDKSKELMIGGHQIKSAYKDLNAGIKASKAGGKTLEQGLTLNKSLLAPVVKLMLENEESQEMVIGLKKSSGTLKMMAGLPAEQLYIMPETPEPVTLKSTSPAVTTLRANTPGTPTPPGPKSGLPTDPQIRGTLMALGEGLEKLADSMGGNADPDTLKEIQSGKSIKSIILGSLKEIKDPLQGISSIPILRPEIVAGLGQIKGGLELIEKSINEEGDMLNIIVIDKVNDGLVDGSKKLNAGLGKLSSGADQLDDAMGDFINALPLLTENVEKIEEGSNDLVEGVEILRGKMPDIEIALEQIDEGTRILKNGMMKLKTSSGELADGASELVGAVPSLEEAIDEMEDGTKLLAGGILKLNTSATDLREGVSVLNDSIPDLDDGVSQLYDSAEVLNDQLVAGSDEVSESVKLNSNQMSTFIKDPVALEEEHKYEVAGYGIGFAPYFLSLALWIGALMMTFVLTERAHPELDVSRTSRIIGKYLTTALIGTVQAIALSVIVIKIGIRPINYVNFTLFNILVSWVFVAMIQNLTYLFGDVGRFGATIILLLQLTSSGGAFAVELSPQFYQKLSPYIPFTYTIHGMRELILGFGVDTSLFSKDILILGCILIGALVFTIVLKPHHDKVITVVHEKKEELVI